MIELPRVKIAITGGIAEGKSTVLRMLEEFGYRTLSADAVAGQVFLRESTQADISRASGLSQPIDRTQLRQAMALNDAVRRSVNEIMHRCIVDEIIDADAEFIEVPLLFEVCIQRMFSHVWVVTCGEGEQLKRLIDRYGDESHAIAMLSSQLPTRSKIAFADEEIRTNCPLDHVRRLLSAAIERLAG